MGLCRSSDCHVYTQQPSKPSSKLQRSQDDPLILLKRLKGKQGQFRGNLSGRHVDFSQRTAISPESSLSIDKVAGLMFVSKNLTYLKKGSRYHIHNLQQLVQNRPDVWPGPNLIIRQRK